MARASERLGFFDLPREIRDEIYRMSFSKSYTLPKNGGGLGGHGTMRLIRITTSGSPSESHILQISQRMRFEAEEILFNDSTFCLYLSESHYRGPSRELADRFMNLCIYIPIRLSSRHNYNHNHQMLEMFGGSRVGRKICTINFFPHYLVSWVIDTRLFSVLKTFNGFETIRLQILPSIKSAQQRHPWLLMGELLECDLGDATPFEDSNISGLEFHPQGRASAHNSSTGTASTSTL